MRSKLSAITARTPSSLVPFAAQSRDEPLPYSTPAKTTSGTPSALIFHRRVVDRHRLAVGKMFGVAAFRNIAVVVLQHEVLDADIGEGAAHHHFMIAAPRAVLVEIACVDLARCRYLPAGEAALIEPAGEIWSVVILSPNRARMRAIDNIGHRLGRHGHALEIGRVLHIGRADVPFVGLACRAPSPCARCTSPLNTSA